MTADFGWSFEPWVLAPVAVVAGLYLVGRRKIRPRGAWLFWSGLGLLTLALVSPLHEYGEHLFFAHMIEHELLMVVAAPLLVMAQAGPVLLAGLPQAVRDVVLGIIRSPKMRVTWTVSTDIVSASVIHATIVWLWHIPILYQAAVANEGIHVLQHISFIVSALIFWVAVLDRDRRRYGEGAATLALFAMSLQASFLGALITFANRLWYPGGIDPFPICGLDRFEDQSLAGIIMWVPACTLYVIAALILLARWLARLEVRHG